MARQYDRLLLEAALIGYQVEAAKFDRRSPRFSNGSETLEARHPPRHRLLPRKKHTISTVNIRLRSKGNTAKILSDHSMIVGWNESGQRAMILRCVGCGKSRRNIPGRGPRKKLGAAGQAL
jgi:hypothetical protein